MMKRAISLAAQEFHPFCVNRHWKYYISLAVELCKMDHEDKVRILGEIGEIRTLLKQLNQPKDNTTYGLNGSIPRGKRILDIF